MRYSLIAIILAVCVLQTSFASSQVCADFELRNAKTVLLRARNAERAKIIVGPTDSILKVCGIASGGARGYHSPDPNWRETPANEWGLAFKAQRYGDTLVISSSNEIEYLHHLYYFDELKIIVPEKVIVKLENRTLSGDGRADLSEPKAF